jgi:hypothetical protein
MTRSGGVTSEVPVRPRTVPFDVDLGPDPDGRPIAAYSRCRREPRRRDPAIGNVIAQLPQWSSGRGCELYEFDFQLRRESRIPGASTSRASEFLPTVSYTRIAFARTYEHRSGTAGKRAYLYERSLVFEKRRSRRLIAGRRSTLRFCSGGRPRRCRRLIEPGPTALDLHERRLALGWDSGTSTGPTSDVHLEQIGARRVIRKLVSRFESGEIQAAEIVSPSVDTGRLRWYLARFGDTTSSVAQERFGRDVLQAQITPAAGDAFVRTVLAGGFDGRAAFYLLSGGLSSEPCTPTNPCAVDPACSEAEPCQLRTTPSIAFQLIP